MKFDENTKQRLNVVRRGSLHEAGDALQEIIEANELGTLVSQRDVVIEDLQEGETLVWNTGLGKWVNGVAVAGQGEFQPVDATLTALAALDPNTGVVYQTGEDAFTKRAVGVTANTIAAGDHNHDSRYALLVHDHDYASITHNHNGTYALSTHYHDDIYALLSHNHDLYYITIVTTPTTGNFPVLTAGGELDNSSYGPSSFAAASHNHGTDYVAPAISISTTHSLTGGGDLSQSRTLSLVNDTASPGINKVYGTDGSGVRTWKNDPAGEGSTYTDEQAQDAIGTILVDSTSINFTYNDATPSVTAAAIFGTGAGTVAEGNHTHSQLHDPITLSGTPDYITLSGQNIVRGQIDLTADVVGNLPVTHLGSGTGADATTYLRGDMTWVTPAGGGGITLEEAQDGVGTILVDSGSIDFTYNDATPSITATVIFGTTSTTACVGNDARLSDARTPTAHNHDSEYVSVVGTPTTGNFPVLTAGGELNNSAYGPSDFAADDHTHGQLHDPITLGGTLDYITLSGQVLTRNAIDLAADVTGNLPVTNLGSGTGASATTFWRGDGTWVTPTDTNTVYTDEQAQDAVGTILVDSASINFTYTDAAPSITAVAIFGTTATTVCVGNDARLSDARTPLSHDHSTNKLAQANTHETPDTDVATTSLHHTIGTSATQAAAGNHTHAQLHDAVTLGGSLDYLTLSGQVITRNAIDLAADVTGNLPVTNLGSGTGASNQTFWRGDGSWATPSGSGGLSEATSTQVRDGTASVAISPSVLYSALSPVTLTDGANVSVNMNAGIIFKLTLGGNRTIDNPTNQKVGQSGEFWIFQDETGGRTLAWGTNYTFVGGTPVQPTSANAVCVVAYRVMASGEVRCVANTGTLVNLATDTTGILPAIQAPIRATVTETGTTRTNTSADAQNWVRFTNTGAKGPTVSAGVASAGHEWVWYNAAATGNMTLVAGAGITLTGNLIFAPLKAALIHFTSTSAADVIGGSAS